MTSVELLNLDETLQAALSRTDMMAAADEAMYHNWLGEDGQIPSDSTELLTVTVMSVTQPADLVVPRYFPNLRQSRGEVIWQKIQDPRLTAPSQQAHLPAVTSQLELVRDTVSPELPFNSPDSAWSINEAYEAKVARLAKTEQTPKDALTWLAEKTLEIARRPAQASEAIKKGASGFDSVRKSLGQITLHVARENMDIVYSQYDEIVPNPKSLELARQAVIQSENEARYTRQSPSKKNNLLAELIEANKVDPETYKRFRQQIACYALTLAWECSIVEEREAKNI